MLNIKILGSKAKLAGANTGRTKTVPSQAAARFWQTPAKVRKIAFLVLSTIFILTLSPLPVFSAGICDSNVPGCTCTVTDLNGNVVAKDVPSLACFAPIISNVINVAFSFLGAITLFFLLFGAVRFVISSGDQKAVQAARNTMTYAVIGLVFILLSFTIVQTITKVLGLPSFLDNFTLYQNSP